jgi:hypothetical protein
MLFISRNALKGIYLFNNSLNCEIIIHIFKSKDPNQQLKLELYDSFNWLSGGDKDTKNKENRKL